MTRVEYAISTYKNLTLEEVEDFNKAMGLLPNSIDQYAEAIRRGTKYQGRLIILGP